MCIWDSCVVPKSIKQTCFGIEICPLVWRPKDIPANQLVSISFAAEPLDDKIPDWPLRDYPPSKTSPNASTSFKTTTDNRDADIDIASKSPKTSIAATAYSFADLQAATNSFAQENLVGEGSLGCVYNGDFQDGQVWLGTYFMAAEWKSRL